MKQSTLFGVVIRSSALNGRSEQSCGVNQMSELDRAAVKDEIKDDDTLSAQSQLKCASDGCCESVSVEGHSLQVSGTKLQDRIQNGGKVYNSRKKQKPDETLSVEKSLKSEKSSSQAEIKTENKISSDLEHDKSRRSVKISSATSLNSPNQAKSEEDSDTDHVQNETANLSSDVKERQVADSIAYEDFIAQFTPKNVKQDQLVGPTESNSGVGQSKSRESRTMSYSEFIRMFKPPPAKSSEDSKLTDAAEEENMIVPETGNQKETKCRSVASYFSKIERVTKVQASNANTVTVLVEIHPVCQEVEGIKKISDTNAFKLPGKMAASCMSSIDSKDDIEFLGSETVAEPETDMRKISSVKKRKNEVTEPAVESSKKQKSDIVKNQNVESSSSSSEVSGKPQMETASEVVEKLVIEPQARVSKTMKINSVFVKDGVVRSGKEIEKKLHPDSSDTEDSGQAQSVASATPASKTSQSMLYFGKTGFSIQKKTEMKKETSAVEESSSDMKRLDRRSNNRLSSKKTPKPDNEEMNRQDIHRDVKEDEAECEDKLLKRDLVSYGGSHDLLSGSQQVTETEEAEISDGSAQNITVLRRSVRLARSVQTTKDADVVEVESGSEEDSGDDDEQSKAKKSSKKEGTQKSSIRKGSPGGRILKKPPGKLAPIFTLLKSKEGTPVSTQRPVDPEQDRLRREFLMSGIPEELKRQIASTSSTFTQLDYPPLPTVSHIQQLPEDSCLSARIRIPHLLCASSEEYFDSKILVWNNLKWEKPEKSFCPHVELFQKFTTHVPLKQSQLDLVFAELQSCDSRFPFRETYMYLQPKIAASELPSSETFAKETTSAVGSLVGVDNDDDDDVVIVDADSPLSRCHNVKSSSELRTSLWSDLHQPESSEHIIGNTKSVKQLKKWLEEWKVVVDKQARKANRAAKTTSKSKGKGGWSDDSDFTDSEEEEMSLCNSVLITGPHGVGKTSSVYALAKELGYKVFEVNSSSLRSGKQLLAQLEEATQSHRVAQNKSKSSVLLDTPSAGTSRPGTRKTGKEVRSMAAPKSAPSVAHAFANLFRTAPETKHIDRARSHNIEKGERNKISVTESKSKKSISGDGNLKIVSSSVGKTSRTEGFEGKEERLTRTRKRHKSNDGISPAVIKKKKGSSSQHAETLALEPRLQTNSECAMSSGSLNLASASLILFDEVDIVFEEDKGFLLTVQHFMTTTKVPIILTSTDVSFHHRLLVRHDHIHLHQPSLISAASFLSTVCLVHGVRVGHQSILNAVRYLKGDIRRCLLYLQYWCESGGGLVRVTKEMNLNSQSALVKSSSNGDVVEKVKDGEQHLKTAGSKIVVTDDDSDSCDFVCLRASKRKTPQIRDEDDSLNDVSRLEIQCQTSTQKSAAFQRRKKREYKKVSSSRCRNISIKNMDGELDEDCPPLHICFEGDLGLGRSDVAAKTVLDFIKAPTLSCLGLEDAVQTCLTIIQALSIDPIYHVVLHGLPLPYSDSLLTKLTIPGHLELPTPKRASHNTAWKRIVEGSDSSEEDSCEKQEPAQQSAQNDNCHQTDTDCCMQDNNELISERNAEKETVEDKSLDEVKVMRNISGNSQSHFAVSVLSEFAKFYDSLSFIDYLKMLPSSQSHSSHGTKLIPGLGDDEIKHSDLAHDTHNDWSHHISGSVHVLAARKLHSRVDEHVKQFLKHNCDRTNLEIPGNSSVKEESTQEATRGSMIEFTNWQEEFHLPVGKSLPDLWNIADKEEHQMWFSDPCVANVRTDRGPMVYGSDVSIHLDYIPYLREICRVENVRQLAKSQRRFHHYLDSIGMRLKESTIASLTSAYTISSSGRQEMSSRISVISPSVTGAGYGQTKKQTSSGI